MAMKVDIVKNLPGFALEVAFDTEVRTLGLLGASGCGKSLTLKCLAGLVRPDRGKIELDGEILFDSSAKKHVPARDRRAGLVFQNYALFPHLTVLQNISIGVKDSRSRRSIDGIAALIEDMQLKGLEKRYPNQLSGGQQQRVALARALALEPRFLLLDEPFSALDPFLREHTLKWIAESLRSYKGHIVFVSHNIEEAYRLCDRLIVMKQGKVDCAGNNEAIVNKPPTLEAAAICGCNNISRALRLDSNRIRALDWGIELRVNSTKHNNNGSKSHLAHSFDTKGMPTVEPGKVPEEKPESDAVMQYVGIRENALLAASESSTAANCFPAWIADFNRSLHHVSLYLKIAGIPSGSADYHLEWKTGHDEAQRILQKPEPFEIQLHPESLFMLY